jgi:hypothetical protein
VFVVRDLASLCLYYALRLISCSVGTFLSSRFRKYNLEQVIIYIVLNFEYIWPIKCMYQAISYFLCAFHLMFGLSWLDLQVSLNWRVTR